MASVAAQADMHLFLRTNGDCCHFSWHAFYRRFDAPSVKGLLRRSPNADKSFFGPVIDCGQLLHVQSHKQVNGFVAVALEESDPDDGRPPYWVRAKHLLWLKDECTQWVVLDDKNWYAQSWTLTVSQLSIRVPEGGLLVSDVEDFDEVAGKAVDAFRSEGYTYVSLDVDYPWSVERAEQVCHAHHITLGYLPCMEEPDRRAFKRRLAEVLHKWSRLAPDERPAELTQYRLFERKTPQEVGYDVYRLIPIAGLSADIVNDLVEDGLLTLRSSAHATLKRPVTEEALRLHKRDSNCKDVAVQRVAALGINDGTLHMKNPDAGLGGPGSLELYDLLEYFADALLYYRESYSHDCKGKLIVPRVTSPSTWHCTRQGDWMQKRIRC